MMMRTELKEHLKKYWYRYAITLFGAIFLISGDIGDDPKLTLFVCGGFITLCGFSLIDSQRISDLNKKIEDLERKKIDVVGEEDDL